MRIFLNTIEGESGKGGYLFKQQDALDFVYFIREGSVTYSMEFTSVGKYTTKYMQFMKGKKQN